MEDSELPAMLARDADHWWYRGRRRIVTGELERLSLPCGARLLDAGCGSGRTLDDLARFGRVTGLDLSPMAVRAARGRGHDVRQADILDMPLPDARFDAVTCLDVLEHIRDDRRALSELLRVTRPGGAIVVTVPAYPSLWSAHDLANEHFRRYRRTTLRLLAADAGGEFVRDTHFNALLLAPIAIVRRMLRRPDQSRTRRSDLDLTPPGLDRVLELPLRAEARFLAAGGRLPFGLSLLIVLRRAGPVTGAPAPALRRRRFAPAPPAAPRARSARPA
jgi:SAM-dependent methyltransferase